MYNKESCSCCFGCRVFIRRQQIQLIQQRMLFLLFWLSCYILRTTTGTTCTTKNVVPVVLVVVLYFKDDNSNNLYNKESCSCCFGCRVIILDDNWNNLYNQQSCPRCSGCRGTTIIAHLSENVNLVVINIDKLRRANRSEKALRRAKNANRPHC